ncbi:hypothetical protein [Desulfatitalea alkaliphila]|uniref:NADH:flavin oxidoreductase/NADH oxidase N-terminal domain-containing protein n=1 Tax=Desulfatitalea alkaliphila TaxID=2929485 RepID=A0AA41R5W9_9BACT|nr:hypothetical protein [Desulfatitalea alkaliphila]MCJ8502038.1 hypothetical protein [Desulfatitalea alkaliphila]
MPTETPVTNPDHAPLFQAADIGGHRLRNRLVALPLFTGYADPEGAVTPLMIDHYRRLALSGAALVVVGNGAISPGGVTSRCNLRVHGDAFLPGLARLAEAIREAGALACLQLNHGGPFAKAGRPLVPSPMDAENILHDVASLRAFMETFPVKQRFRLTQQMMEMLARWQRPMTDKERHQTIADFGAAARLAREAGFDMVELHGGTGYLLASYLSAYSNKIDASLGGSPAERAAFPLAVLQEVRRRLPPDYPVGWRLMVREWVPDGIDLPEAVAFARRLEEEGVAYLSLTAGSYTSMFKPEVTRITARPGHLAQEGTALKAAVRLPVVLSGRLFTPAVAAKVLRRGAADLIGLARPLLADPRWPQKAAVGRKVRVCVNCGFCLQRVIHDQGVACVRWTEAQRVRIDLETDLLSRRTGRTLVVAAEVQDLAAIRANRPPRFPPAAQTRVRFLLLHKTTADPAFEAAIPPFLGWLRSLRQVPAAADGEVDWVIRTASQPLDREVLDATQEGRFGVILLGTAPAQGWRERLAAKHTSGAIGFLGTHPRPTKILVPCDLSADAGLLLRYIHHAYPPSRFDITFAHVLEKERATARQQWRQALEIQGWDPDTPLKVLPAGQGAAEALLGEMTNGGYGTVVMGRRNVTGVRRWLLGSVSAAVMQRISDQNLILVG